MAQSNRPRGNLDAEGRLVALAVLKAQWDQAERGYSETFLPFIGECVAKDGRQRIPLSDLAGAIRQTWGFEIPEAVIRSVVERQPASDIGKVERHTLVVADHVRYRVPDALRAEIAREQNALLDALVSFAEGEHGVSLGRTEAEAALIHHVAVGGSGMLVSLEGRGGSALGEGTPEKLTDYVVGSFIDHVLSSDPANAGYLERLVVGTMIATALWERDLDVSINRFDDLYVFLDTPIVIDILGRAGGAPSEAGRESTRLLASVGARIACFEHTVAEARSIYVGLAEALRAGFQRGRRAPSFGSVEEYAIAHGLGPTELLQASERIEEDLSRLGVQVEPAPEHSARLEVVDESTAIQLLIDQVHRQRRNATRAARYDFDSLSATYRWRRGRTAARIETAGAVFATVNRAVQRCSRALYTRAMVGDVGIAISLGDLVTIGWMKAPAESPTLPRLVLAANAYAAVRPSPAMIERYTSTIIALRESDQLSDSDVHELRYGMESHSILMRKTRGVEDRIDEPTVIEILGQARQELAERAAETAGLESAVLRERLDAESAAHSASRAVAETQAQTLARELKDQRSARTAAENEALDAQAELSTATAQLARSRRDSDRLRIALACVVEIIVLATAALAYHSGNVKQKTAVVFLATAILCVSVAVVAFAGGRRRAGFAAGAITFIVAVASGIRILVD